jgi:NAD(P)-dependent dehydrogenase (short-subunit alcohol dehydrogenase family)
MDDRRSVVITGASRGLGLASAARLYARGWHVVAAMRSPGTCLERLRSVTGAAPGDPGLAGERSPGCCGGCSARAVKDHRSRPKAWHLTHVSGYSGETRT